MDRTKSLMLALLVVAAIVGLEEWRLADARGQIRQLQADLAKAEAEKPPPPRPVPPGEDPEKLLSRTKSLQKSEEPSKNAPSTPASSESPTPTEPVAETNPEPTPADTAPEPEPTPTAAQPSPQPVPIRDQANQALRNAVVKQYAALIEKFQFNSVEAGYFVDLLVEDALNRRRLAAELGNVQTEAERAAVQARARQLINDVASRMREFLGNDQDFAIYQEYRRRLKQAAAQGQN